MTRSLPFAIMTSLVVSIVSLPAQAGLVGNELSARTAAADGDTRVLYSNWYSTPVASTVDSVDIFFQGDTTTFNLFVLRPTGVTNQYDVVYDSGTIMPSGTPNTTISLALPNGPANVQPGDVFAHYGRGIPFSDANNLNAVNPQFIHYPSPAAPVDSTTITLGSASFPSSTIIRDYASAVNVPGVLEQVGWGTTQGPLVDTAAGVTGVMDDHGFTLEGKVDQWHFFSDSSATDRFVTPLLFEVNGDGTFDIVGVGTPRQNTNAGLQMHEFELVAGTDEVGPGIVPGWWDGNFLTGIANLGVIEWKNGIGTGSIPLFQDLNGVALGEIYGPGSNSGFGTAPFVRQYSINFSTQAIPEPATAMLAMFGAAGLMLRRRRAVQ